MSEEKDGYILLAEQRDNSEIFDKALNRFKDISANNAARCMNVELEEVSQDGYFVTHPSEDNLQFYISKYSPQMDSTDCNIQVIVFQNKPETLYPMSTSMSADDFIDKMVKLEEVKVEDYNFSMYKEYLLMNISGFKNGDIYNGNFIVSPIRNGFITAPIDDETYSTLDSLI